MTMAAMQGFFLECPGAFAAGLLSFLSPCVFPLVPSYLAILSVGGNRSFRRSLAFSLGFTLVFIALGLVFSRFFYGASARPYQIAAGSVAILLGLNTIFDFMSFLNREWRFHGKAEGRGLLPPFLLGAAFGAGWTPCIGPMLASILFLAGGGPLFQALILLLLYSSGLAIPFILAGFFLERAEKLFNAVKRNMGKVKLISGLFIIAVGVYMISGRLSSIQALAGYFARFISSGASDKPLAFRLGFSAFYLLAAVFPAYKALKARRGKPRPWPLYAASAVFLSLFVLEITGLISTPRFIASWFMWTV